MAAANDEDSSSNSDEHGLLLSKVEQKLSDELIKFENKFDYPVNPSFQKPNQSLVQT